MSSSLRHLEHWHGGQKDQMPRVHIVTVHCHQVKGTTKILDRKALYIYILDDPRVNEQRAFPR